MQNKEKHSQAAVLGLQHLLAMYSGSILVPIMIAGALGYSAHELTYLISTDIFMCGVAVSYTHLHEVGHKQRGWSKLLLGA